MTKEMLIQMIKDYGEACEMYSYYQDETKGIALDLRNNIIAEIEKIFAEKT